MFCYKCGKELPDDSEFCYECGTKQPANNTASYSAPDQAVTGKSVPTQHSESVSSDKIDIVQPYQRSYNNPMPLPANKKFTKKAPIIIAVAAILAVIAIIAVFLFNGRDDKPTLPTTTNANSDITTVSNVGADSESSYTSESNDVIDIADDNVGAQEGHYTVKDLAQYFGFTSDEITERLGEPTDVSLFSQVNLRYFFGDELCFLWVGGDGAPLSQITVSASILERNGETLDKTVEELIAILGVPKNENYIYDENGQISGHTMEYLLNKNAYVSFTFGSNSDKASTVDLSLYNDNFPLDMDYIEGLFEYSQQDITSTFGSPIYFYFDSSSFVSVLSYNVFTSNIDTGSGLMNSMEILANSITINGQTLNKSSSEIISLLGAPTDKGIYSDNYHKYFLKYILDDKWELTILMKDANSNAHMVSIKQYQEKTFENMALSYSTRDGYNSTLTLDPYGGFVLEVNRMAYFSTFSGTYQKTDSGYQFEVLVGKGELDRFEMTDRGKNLVYYGESIGATINGVTTYYPDRTLDDILYNGEPVYQYLTINGNAPDSVLSGEFNANQLTVYGKKLNMTQDEIMSTFGAMHSSNIDSSKSEYTLTYWIVKSYTTFDVTFYYSDYSRNAQKVKITELYMP